MACHIKSDTVIRNIEYNSGNIFRMVSFVLTSAQSPYLWAFASWQCTNGNMQLKFYELCKFETFTTFVNKLIFIIYRENLILVLLKYYHYSSYVTNSGNFEDARIILLDVGY